MHASKSFARNLAQAFSNGHRRVSVIRGLSVSVALTVFCIVSVPAKTHVIKVWSGYYQFLPQSLTVLLGDTIQWRPLDIPQKTHDIVSKNIPAKAKPFEKTWEAPADTFFQYIPAAAGLYEYECVPHHDRFMKGSFTVQATTSIPRNAPLPSVLLEHLNPSRRELNFSEPYIGYPFALYDHVGKKLFSGITGRSVDFSIPAPGRYFLRVYSERPLTQKLVFK